MLTSFQHLPGAKGLEWLLGNISIKSLLGAAKLLISIKT